MTWTPEVSDYEFYYWSVPFRGQFVRAVLTEDDDDAIEKVGAP